MDILDRRHDDELGPEISVVSASFLPEPETEYTGSLANSEFIPKRAADLFQLPPHPIREWHFDRLEQQVDPRLMSCRLNEQMNVIGHEDIGDKMTCLTDRGPVETFDKQLEQAIIREQRYIPITGKCY
jgi:hypothetical protein